MMVPSPAADAPPPRLHLRELALAHGPELLLLLVAAMALLGRGLGHPSIHNWDEAAHQAVTRGTFESFFRPHIYADPLYPQPLLEWMSAGVFLHKPTGPFWFGALAMHLVGITPLALRLGSWLGALAAAIGAYLLARRAAGRPLALLAGLGFLALPFGYELCQGYIFGDATDCTLAGWVTTALLLLVLAVERGSWRWATVAGAATGVGYLCKTALALVPLGVAVAFAVLGVLGLTKKLPWKALAAFIAALVALAAPWNVYCALAFPAEYRFEAAHTLAHLFGTEIAQWIRPWDAIPNEIAHIELGPIPLALPVLALGWGLWRAGRRRETAVVALALWVLATWLVLSIARVKVPGTAWGAVPGVLALLAVLLADAARIPALAGAVLGGALGEVALELRPGLAAVARALPPFFAQTRDRPQLAVGLLLAAIGAAVFYLVSRTVTRGKLPSALGRWAAVAAGGLGFAVIVQAQRAHAEELSLHAEDAPMREVGLALDRALPKQGVLFLAVERDPPTSFSLQDLMFWSGRMAYRRPPDPALAHAHRLHPYLVSATSEPFAPVPGVPAFAAARAYDLDQPAPMSPLPQGVLPASARGLGHELLGFSVGPRDGAHDLWAFYLHAQPGFRLPLRFTLDDGRVLDAALDTASTFTEPRHLASRPWVIATYVGPRAERVRTVSFDGAPFDIPHS